MKLIFAVFFIISDYFYTVPAFASSNITLPLYSQVYSEQRDPFKDAIAAITLAKETNRNVLIEIGGTWCTWCHKMDAFLAKNPEVYHQ